MPAPPGHTPSSRPEKPLSSGQLARLTGLSASSIHRYVAEGLIYCTRTFTGRRLFSRETVHRVKRILLLRDMGLSVPQIKSLLVDTDLMASDTESSRAAVRARLKVVLEQKRQLAEEEQALRAQLAMLDAAMRPE
jgi:MerR family transcriptional regulator, thiopeptide resistance regulator